MFIQTETTPNPATLKFLPGRAVLADGTLDMRDKAAAARSPLAARLFDIDGVGGVFFGSDFIAITKTDGEWQQLKPALLGAIMEHFMAGGPVLNAGVTPEQVIREGDTAEQILKLIDEDEDISVLVLAAGVDDAGPGPLVSTLGTTAGSFPVPIAIVPGHLSDEDLDAMS